MIYVMCQLSVGSVSGKRTMKTWICIAITVKNARTYISVNLLYFYALFFSFVNKVRSMVNKGNEFNYIKELSSWNAFVLILQSWTFLSNYLILLFIFGMNHVTTIDVNKCRNQVGVTHSFVQSIRDMHFPFLHMYWNYLLFISVIFGKVVKTIIKWSSPSRV